MNLKTVNGIYISPEDIDYATTYCDEYKNRFTTIYTKAGNKVKVLGDAYHILYMKEAKENGQQ
jgi:hypothetical protein